MGADALVDHLLVDGLAGILEGLELFLGGDVNLGAAVDDGLLGSIAVLVDQLVVVLAHLGGALGDDGAELFGQAVPPVSVDVEGIGVELVVDLGEVLLDFVELHAHDVDPGVLLAVGNAGLEAHVEVSVRNGGGGGAEGNEGHVDGLHAVGAHLEALQVLRLGDGVLVVGELTVAAGVAEVDDDGAGGLLGLSADLLGQVGLEQSGHFRAGVGEEGGGEHEKAGAEVKLAAAHALGNTLDNLLEHFLLGAELAVAKDGDGHMAVGFLGDVCSKLLHGDIAGIAFGLGMTDDHLKIAEVGIGIIGGECGAAEGQQHHGYQQNRQQFFHLGNPPSFFLLS